MNPATLRAAGISQLTDIKATRTISPFLFWYVGIIIPPYKVFSSAIIGRKKFWSWSSVGSPGPGIIPTRMMLETFILEPLGRLLIVRYTVADKTGAQNLKLTLYLRHMSATFVVYTI
ncbi:hypothetical protein G6F38_013965 [Rhizopus arrhizus]|nr:hypothetical protein G6F38_013965 [Rhizopus arrhizus]